MKSEIRFNVKVVIFLILFAGVATYFTKISSTHNNASPTTDKTSHSVHLRTLTVDTLYAKVVIADSANIRKLLYRHGHP